MVDRRNLDDPLDALIQLTLSGVTFEVKGDKLTYSNLPVDPATQDFFRIRLDLIRQHKAEVIAWLNTRTNLDTLEQLNKTSVFLAEQVAYCEERRSIWDSWMTAWRQLLILALNTAGELESTVNNVRLSEDDSK